MDGIFPSAKSLSSLMLMRKMPRSDMSQRLPLPSSRLTWSPVNSLDRIDWNVQFRNRHRDPPLLETQRVPLESCDIPVAI